MGGVSLCAHVHVNVTSRPPSPPEYLHWRPFEGLLRSEGTHEAWLRSPMPAQSVPPEPSGHVWTAAICWICVDEHAVLGEPPHTRQ